MYQQYDHHSTSSLEHLRGNQESHSSDKNSTNEYNKEVIAQGGSNGFGIVSKTNADSQGNTSTELSDVPETKEEDGEVHEYAAPKSTNTQNGENTDKGNKLEDIKEQKQNGMVIITKIEKKNDDEEEDDDEDDDDYDDVSIIIGSDDTASFNNSFNKETKGEHKSSRSRPRYQKIYHNSYSEPSFRRSSSNLSINGSMNYSQGPYMQPQPIYFCHILVVTILHLALCLVTCTVHQVMSHHLILTLFHHPNLYPNPKFVILQ